MIFHTAPIGYLGPDRLDITRGSGTSAGILFAPSWAILRPAKQRINAGTMTPAKWTAYANAYTDEMRRCYRYNREVWDALLERPRVVAVCYCDILPPRPPWCHRRVLAAILAKLGAVDAGELPADG